MDDKGKGLGDHEGTPPAADHVSYPKLDPQDINPPPQDWSAAYRTSTIPPQDSNPYVVPSSAPPNNYKANVDSVKDTLGKWGKMASEEFRKAETIAGNMWQHLKTGPSVADAAVGRIAQGTKVLAEGGHEKIFAQKFECVPEEKLVKTFACYLSTSAGPVMGVLYLSNVKIAFGSDSPLAYKVGEETQWSYYNIVLPLQQIKAVNSSTSKLNPAEKYIQVIAVDNHEFWFMGFVYYDNAVKYLKEATGHRS